MESFWGLMHKMCIQARNWGFKRITMNLVWWIMFLSNGESFKWCHIQWNSGRSRKYLVIDITYGTMEHNEMRAQQPLDLKDQWTRSKGEIRNQREVELWVNGEDGTMKMVLTTTNGFLIAKGWEVVNPWSNAIVVVGWHVVPQYHLFRVDLENQKVCKLVMRWSLDRWAGAWWSVSCWMIWWMYGYVWLIATGHICFKTKPQHMHSLLTDEKG